MILFCKNCNKQYEIDLSLGNWNCEDKQIIAKGKGSGSKTVRADLFCSYRCGKDFIQKKIKNTNIERYGVENPFQSEDIKIKIKNTMLKKYNVDNISKLDKIKDDKKETFELHYNCGYGKSEIVNNKRKNTCLNKYGVDSCLKSEIIRNKIKKTCLERYGVENPAQTDEVKEKIKRTFLERYGETSNMKVPELYEKNLISRLNNGCLYSSKMEKKWLDLLDVKIRQKYIHKFLVDGYDDKTNTVYEFLGDKWHANPRAKNKGEFFTEESEDFVKTLDRFLKLSELGYTIIYCWEYDWLRNCNLTRVFLGKLEY